MKAKPICVELTRQSVRFTSFIPVPGASYLQPAETFVIPVAQWAELMKQPPAAGEASYTGFTREQIEAMGI